MNVTIFDHSRYDVIFPQDILEGIIEHLSTGKVLVVFDSKILDLGRVVGKIISAKIDDKNIIGEIDLFPNLPLSHIAESIDWRLQMVGTVLTDDNNTVTEFVLAHINMVANEIRN